MLKKMQLWHFLLFLFIVLMILHAFFILPWSPRRDNSTTNLITWGITGTMIAFIIFMIGQGITRVPLGALINDHNRMSLTQLQLITWTAVILSAFFTAVLWNISIRKSNPLAIVLPSQIWLLLGINLASFITSPLILSTKTNNPANQEAAVQQLELKNNQKKQQRPRGNSVQEPAGDKVQDQNGQSKLKENASNSQDTFNPDTTLITRLNNLKSTLKIDIQGQVIHFLNPAEATLADLFQGDEVGNFAQLDIGKVQMFLFTLIVVVVYVSVLSTVFIEADAKKGITSFPTLDQSMITLLAISHAGYLAYKTVPHTTAP